MTKIAWRLLCQTTFVPFYNNRGFPKVDHCGTSARIVLEQINSAKQKPSSNGSWTLDPRTVCYSMPFGVAWAYYGKVLVLANAASWNGHVRGKVK